MNKANEFISDPLIIRLADLLGSLDAVQAVEELEKEQQNNKLLKSDVEKVVSSLTPNLLLTGIITGGLTVSKHVIKHNSKPIQPHGEGFASNGEE